MYKNDNILNEANSRYEEAKSAWRKYFAECKEDLEFKAGKQWSDSDKAILDAKKLPALSINMTAKNINLVSGYERQNRSDIKVMPVEGGDEYMAEVLSRVIKWIMCEKGNNYVRSDAFKDSITGGLGWLSPYIDYTFDPVSGDILIKKVSPFEILMDPHTMERDLSDCQYIIRHKKVSRETLKRLFPDKEYEISTTGAPITNDDITQYTIVPSDLGNNVLVLEYWYRCWVKKKFVVNMADESDIKEWDDEDGNVADFLSRPENANFIAIERDVQVLKMACIADGKVILYDGDSPFGGSDYPFIPIFCFYESALPDWDLKLQGLVRGLKDLQREKNKRRSQIMQALGTSVHSGWMMEENAIDDPDDLAKSAGTGKIIKYKPGKPAPAQIQGPPPPVALIQAEQMFDNDMYVVGMNPDQLGQVGEKGAPGVAIELRQKAGITSIQEVFDSLAYASRALGRWLVSAILRNFSTNKIKRILGDDFYFAKKKKFLMLMLREAMNTQPEMPNIQPQIDSAEDAAYKLATPEGKEAFTVDKQAEMQAAAQDAMQAQMAEKQRQIAMLKQQIDDIDAEEEGFWQTWEQMKNNTKFDVTIDEISGSPTYRASMLTTLTQLQQYGIPVPPKFIIEFMDIDRTMKEEWDQEFSMAAQQQQALAKSKVTGK